MCIDKLVGRSLLVVCIAWLSIVPAAAQLVSSVKDKGDWPMLRGGMLRDNRARIKGNIKTLPELAWRHQIGAVSGGTMNLDLDEDGQMESYGIESWRLIRRDGQGAMVWESAPITRGATLVGFEDLDGDGKREPLMLGSGLNTAAPLYFVFDPKTGKIRWKAELTPSNGGDTRFGKIDSSRKGLQLLRSLFPNPGGGEMHMFCFDRGVEDGYQLWSWQRYTDFIYFPQLAAGDVNGDGQNEILMLSQMCVWMFDSQLGNEISRAFWGKRSRSYGGQFGLYSTKPGPTPSIVNASAYNKISVVDIEIDTSAKIPKPLTSSLDTNDYVPPKNMKLVLRWDREFEPGVGDAELKGAFGSGNPTFFPDSVCDLDGDGWSEIVVGESAGYPDAKWHTVVLSAKEGKTISDLPGKIVVGAADVNGDGKAEVFLRDRVEKHDPVSGPVSVARWVEGKGLQVVWTAPEVSELVREPNDPALHLSRHPDEGTRVKLANTSGSTNKAFFVKSSAGQMIAYTASGADQFMQATASAPPDRILPLSGAAISQSQPMDPPLVADFDGDGRNDIILRANDSKSAEWRNERSLYVLKAPAAGQTEPTELTQIKGVLENPGSKSAGPLFADLDGDGKLEMVATRLHATTATTESNLPKEQPCVEVTKADGTLVWRKTWPADFKNKFVGSQWGFAITYLAVGHFTGKNPLDIAVSYTGENQGGNMAVLDGSSGKSVWNIGQLYPKMYGEAWDFNAPVVFDYDGDGLDDLATTPQTVHYIILKGKDGKQLLDIPRDVTSQNMGANEVGEKALFPKAWTTGPLLGAGDVDGDGKPELAVFSSQAAVGVFHPNGEQLWFLNLLVTNQMPSPGCWVDIDGDGKDEVAFIHKEGVLRVYEGLTGAIRWEENLNSIGPIVGADVDGDGGQEILFSSEKGALICLGNKTNPLNGSHIKWALDLKAVPAQAVFADVNGDGIGEIIVPTSDGNLNCLVAGK